MKRKLCAALLVTLALSGGSLLAPEVPAAPAQDGGELRPMIFVHGFLGSGQQFESQALRLASNGYPADHIEMFEHNSLAWPGSQDEVWARLDQAIADLQAATGADQVNLLGHSQGTGVVQGYLNSDPARAAEVAQYVNLDGGPGGTVPAEVDTLAIWGEGDPAREIPGATNVQFADQSHTEVVNSPETFEAIYEFFTGQAPTFPEVVREPADQIEVSGRALLFPENLGADGATMNIYAVDGETGQRLDDAPEATFELDETGAWGPFAADGETFYEIAITRADSPNTHHVYVQRFVRSSRWVRVLTSEPGGLSDSFWEFSDNHSNVVVLRNKEWWGDQGEDGDQLEVNGSPIVNEVSSPRSNRTIAIFVHDAGVDGVTDLTTPAEPTGLPFLAGVDLVIPAADPPTDAVDVVTTPRRGDGPEAVCIPNWASSQHRSSIQFASYHHLLNPDGSPAEGHASPDCATPAEPGPGPEQPDLPDQAPPAIPVTGAPSFTG